MSDLGCNSNFCLTSFGTNDLECNWFISWDKLIFLWAMFIVSLLLVYMLWRHNIILSNNRYKFTYIVEVINFYLWECPELLNDFLMLKNKLSSLVPGKRWAVFTTMFSNINLCDIISEIVLLPRWRPFWILQWLKLYNIKIGPEYVFVKKYAKKRYYKAIYLNLLSIVSGGHSVLFTNKTQMRVKKR